MHRVSTQSLKNWRANQPKSNNFFLNIKLLTFFKRIRDIDYFPKLRSRNKYFCYVSFTNKLNILFYLNNKDMGSSETKIFNYQLANSKSEGFTSIYRKKGVHKFKEFPQQGIVSLRDALKLTRQRHGQKYGLGQILVDKTIDQNGQQIEVRSIRAHTYNQIYSQAYYLGRFLYGNKLFYSEDLFKMKLVGIHSKNRYQWFITDWACILFGLTSVPLYDTLGYQNLSFCLNQTLMTTIFVTKQTIKTLCSLENMGHIKTMISYDPIDSETKLLLNARGITSFDLKTALSEGERMDKIHNGDIIIQPDQCFTFSYTSGTTGPPKGAMISHRNFLTSITGYSQHQDFKFNSQDIYLSYLPLPHLMERSLAIAMFAYGAYVVVSSGNTAKMKEDCQISKVSVFLSVPRVYNRIVQAVKDKFAAEEGFKKWLIDTSVNSKLANAKENGDYSHIIYDSLVFSKVREGFGGNIRMLGTGSAPLSAESHAYMKTIMCCPLLQGYGQTQNTGGAIYNRASDSTYGYLTEICSGLEVRLCDIPEMKYSSKDINEKGEPRPRGEVCLRGPQVFMGYYKQPELTRQTIDKQGWLHTGDVAQLDPQLIHFKIIDRKKNIFKLQQGQYLAPDKIESVYSKSPLVLQCFLHGDSHQYYAVAIVTPNPENLRKLAKERNIQENHEDLCANRAIREAVLSEMNSTGRKEKLNGFQLAKNVWLEPKGFQSKNILTNTLKLIRYEARKVYAEKIKKMYEEGELLIK